MIEKIKKKWLVIGGVVFFGIILWSSWPRNKEEGNTIKTVKIEEQRNDPYLPVELSQPKKVNWMKSNENDGTKTKELNIQRQGIDDQREKEIKNILGMTTENGYVDKENNVISWTKEISSKNQIPGTGKWNLEEDKKKLTDLVEKINGKTEIVWTKTTYQKILYPRWIESVESEAQSVMISGDYVIQGVRASTYFGDSISGIFNRRGELLKIYINLAPEVIKSDKEIKIISTDEASRSPMNIYGIVDRGGAEEINEVNVNKAELINVFDNKRNLLKAYYQLSGNSWVENKSVKITMLVKAEK